jgi:hypothetical protein
MALEPHGICLHCFNTGQQAAKLHTTLLAGDKIRYGKAHCGAGRDLGNRVGASTAAAIYCHGCVH